MDLDQDAECAPPLVRSVLPDPAACMYFRVAVRAVESWLMADAERLAAFLGVPATSIPPDPDAESDPKRTLIALAHRSRRSAIREDIVPRRGNGSRVGPGYAGRLIEFVMTAEDRGMILMQKMLYFLKPHRVMLAVVGLFIVLTVMMTWPLAAQMDRAVIGWVGDNFYFVWLIGWTQKALQRHALPFIVPMLNYPEGWNLAYNDMTPAMVLIALPASLLGGPTFGYNFSIFVSFVLSGMGVYCWINRLTHSKAAGIVAGTAFAFVPYRMSHLLGHLNLMGTQWFPFYFMSLTDLLESRQWSWRIVLLPAVFLGLIAATSQYYLYMSILISLAYAGGYCLLVDHKLMSRILFWKQVGAFAVIASFLATFSIVPYLKLSSQSELPQHSFEEVRVWSASPTNFILPSTQHFIWGEWIKRNFGDHLWIENTLYIGGITFGLAILGIFGGPKQSRGLVNLLVFVCLVSFVMALGTDLHWMGQSVRIDTPSFIQKWQPYSQMAIPLPGYLFFRYLPFYSSMRVWMRYGIFVNLFVSLLAGIGCVWLQKKFGRFYIPGIIVIFVFILIDLYPGTHLLSQVRDRQVDLWLAEQQDQGAVAQFPFWEVAQPQQTYYTLVHGKPFIGGFFAASTTPQFRRIQPVLASFPDQASIILLRELDVRWIIVDSSQYQDLSRVVTSLELAGLKLIADFDGQYLYELK